MKPIDALRNHIRKVFPTAKMNLTAPVSANGFWLLDVDQGKRQLTVQWNQINGFGFSSARTNDFGEGPDVVFETLPDASEYVEKLLMTGDQTTPSLSVLLARLREKRGLTQSQLAERMGVRQSTISGIERREDVQISTLKRIVEALGGTLEIFGRFPEGRYQIDGLVEQESFPSVPPRASLPDNSLEQISAVRRFPQGSGDVARRVLANDIKARGSVLIFEAA